MELNYLEHFCLVSNLNLKTNDRYLLYLYGNNEKNNVTIINYSNKI